MSFYKQFILIILLPVFFNGCSSDIDSIENSDNKITLFNGVHKKEIILSPNGQIVRIETYIDNLPDKSWEADYYDLSDSLEYYGNGQIKTKGYLKNGKQHSLWEYFDREGHLLIQRYFSYGDPTTIWIWYDHDNHDTIDSYELYEDIRDDGILTRYYRSSNIKEKKQYFTKKLTGNYILLYDEISNNGLQKVQVKGQYGIADSLGKKVGNW